MAGSGYRSLIFVTLMSPLGGEQAPAPEERSKPRATVPAGSRSSQYFARGFDLDQGADFALSVDGIPINLPSALQGPGFLDDGFLIGETIQGRDYRKGPYHAEQGAFAIAGAAELEAVEDFERPMLKAGYGGAASDRFGRLLWAETRPGDLKTSYALEATHSYRPWNELTQSAKLNGFLRLGPREPGRGWNFTLLATQEKGDGGAPPPDRPLPADIQEDYDNLRLGDGYQFQRLFLGLNRRFLRGAGICDFFQFYGGLSSLQNWGNSTYKLQDFRFGDQTEQLDRRSFLGFEARRQWQLQAGAVAWSHRAGLQARLDEGGAADLYATFQRTRLAPRMQAQGSLGHAALFAQSTARWGEGWHAFAAARVDSQHNHIGGPSPWMPQNRTATLVSPRLGLGYSPWPDTQVRAAWGQGFRLGNAFRDPRPMIRAHSADLGAQTRIAGPWLSSLTLWTLDLEAESVFQPPLNAPLELGPSWRQGLEWFNEAKWGPWRAEASLAWSRARYRNALPGQEHVPGSIPQTAVLALNWEQPSLKAGIKLRSLGAYALTPDNAIVSGRRTELGLSLSRHGRDWSAGVEVINAFNLRKHTQAYYYTSRLDDEPNAGRPATHTKHGDPQAIRFELCRRF